MIWYFSSHGSRQPISKEPTGVGHSIRVLTEVYGYVVQLEPYQGVKKGK